LRKKRRVPVAIYQIYSRPKRKCSGCHPLPAGRLRKGKKEWYRFYAFGREPETTISEQLTGVIRHLHALGSFKEKKSASVTNVKNAAAGETRNPAMPPPSCQEERAIILACLRALRERSGLKERKIQSRYTLASFWLPR